MTWTRIPDDWSDRADDLELSHDAELFHIRALVLCNKAGNDGHLKARNLAKLAVVFENAPVLIAELIEKLEWTDNGDGTYWVPWVDQELAEVVERRARLGRERQRRYREKGLDMKEEDLSDASRNTLGKSKASDQQLDRGDASRDAPGDLTPSRTVPSRPITGKGTGREIASPSGRSGADAPPPSVGAQQESRSKQGATKQGAPERQRRRLKALPGITQLDAPLERPGA